MEYSVINYLKRAAQEFPRKTVYRDGENTITFGELHKRAESVGTAIAGIQPPGSPVGVMTGRHVYTPACFLGVALAGSFYVPMDPGMPDFRLKQMLSVMDTELLIVDRDRSEKARDLGYEGRILIMEEIMDHEADEALIEKATAQLTDNSPVYMLFTSGSTGMPKGVLTPHRALTCYLEGLQSVIELDSTDILANQAPLDYIAAIRDMYLPLMTGAETVIVSPSEFAMPQLMLEGMSEKGITTICWSAAGLEIPAKLGVFEEAEVKLPPLRRVVFSGSVISNQYLRMWQDAFPDTVFINQYGPTEATGSCTYHIIDRPVEEDTVIPIGRPYPGYNILVLDDEGRPVGDGETGEICVRGPALALGYYNSPEQTARSFVTNPCREKWRETIYKTGDLGKLDKDGTLFFLGRKDRQFKHMGHRIEPEDIEQKASGCEGVEECACVYNKQAETINLYYSGEATRKDLALYLRDILPSFMVPRKIKQTDELPHLPNGKIDWKRLQEDIEK